MRKSLEKGILSLFFCAFAVKMKAGNLIILYIFRIAK